jgi:hypothetical protein
MQRRAFVFAALLGLTISGLAAAAPPLSVKPWVYDPDHTGICESDWVSKVGLPDNQGKANHGLVLVKNGPTATNASAGAFINFQGKLTELGFDVSNDSHCGAGAPRFNVYTTSGVYYFYGCIYGIHTAAPQDPVNWTRVRFAAADGFPSDGTHFISSWENVIVTGIDIVFDEGTDQGNGYAILDNIDVNGTLIGKPGAAK